jgi:prophage tail gpP-like protein
MKLKIGSTDYDFFNAVKVTLTYDSVASVFGFSAYFDPNDTLHRKLFRPLRYQKCTVTHEGETLITGRILSVSFKSEPQKTLVTISGYSTTGILEDCPIPTEVYPLQSDGLTLGEIVKKVVDPFGLSVVVDKAVEDRYNATFTTVEAKADQSAKAYLSEIAAQRGIILSHTSGGALLFTEAKADRRPTFEFADGEGYTSAGLSVNGQQLHSTVTVLRDADVNGGNAGEFEATNPLVGIKRPRVVLQTSGDNNTTEKAAEMARADELKAIQLTVNVPTWVMNGKVLRPNTVISIRDPELFLFKKRNFFVSNVTLSGNEKEQTASLTCVLPETYTLKNPIDIFAE